MCGHDPIITSSMLFSNPFGPPFPPDAIFSGGRQGPWKLCITGTGPQYYFMFYVISNPFGPPIPLMRFSQGRTGPVEAMYNRTGPHNDFMFYANLKPLRAPLPPLMRFSHGADRVRGINLCYKLIHPKGLASIVALRIITSKVRL